jgi:hypothetical protein
VSTDTPVVTSTPTNTSTPVPTETPAYTVEQLAATATSEYLANLSQYVLIEKQDFLNHPWEYDGLRIILRGNLYDILDEGYTLEWWVETGATYDFVGVHLKEPLHSGDDFNEGYDYYAFGTVGGDDTWPIGYGLYDAFLNKTLPSTASYPAGYTITRPDGRVFIMQVDGTWAQVVEEEDAAGPGCHWEERAWRSPQDPGGTVKVCDD